MRIYILIDMHLCTYVHVHTMHAYTYVELYPILQAMCASRNTHHVNQ